MKLFTGRLLLLAFVVTLFSCNPEEPIPAYLEISGFTFVDNPDINEGTHSNKITDAWIYIDNKLIGVFEYPFNIPVLYEGPHTVQVHAGIMQNGIAATRLIYPFFNSYDTIIHFVPDKNVEIKPVFSYATDAKFALMENFEGTGVKLERSQYSDTALFHIKNNPVVFEGIGCGAAYLDDNNILFDVLSIDNLSLPKNTPVYLEINYKTDVGFSTGVLANEPGQVNRYTTDLLVNPSQNWNKIYIDLGLAVNKSFNASSYKLYISADKPIDGTSRSLYLDNIKVVHW